MFPLSAHHTWQKLDISTHFQKDFPVSTVRTAAIIWTDNAVRQWQGFPCLHKCHPTLPLVPGRQWAQTLTRAQMPCGCTWRCEVLAVQTSLAGFADPDTDTVNLSGSEFNISKLGLFLLLLLLFIIIQTTKWKSACTCPRFKNNWTEFWVVK